MEYKKEKNNFLSFFFFTLLSLKRLLLAPEF